MRFQQIRPNLTKSYSQTYICADYIWNKEEKYMRETDRQTDRDQQQSTEPNIIWLCDLAKMLIHSNLYYEYENSKCMCVRECMCLYVCACIYACMPLCACDIGVHVSMWASQCASNILTSLYIPCRKTRVKKKRKKKKKGKKREHHCSHEHSSALPALLM